MSFQTCSRTECDRRPDTGRWLRDGLRSEKQGRRGYTDMIASKEDIRRKPLWDRLAGSRILVIGQTDGGGQTVLRGLQCLRELTGKRFEVTGQEEPMQPADYVILFPGLGDQSCVMAGGGAKNDRKTVPGAGIKRDKENAPGIEKQTKEAGESKEDPWRVLLRLTEQLEQIRVIKPREVLLISDTCVYGKVFGIFHALKEEETGYVCHTDSNDMSAQCMRMAEHLCGRLAREDGVRIKIARVDWGSLLETENHRNGRKASLQNGGPEEEELLEAILRVLLDGVPGEVYNLPGTPENIHPEAGKHAPGKTYNLPGSGVPEMLEDKDGGALNPEEGSGRLAWEGHSALSPMRIVPDCGKAGRL